MVHERNIVIIDDHPLFREGLKTIIEQASTYRVVGEAGTGREGFRLATQLKPDLVIADITLPDESGVKVTRKIRDSLPDTRVMIVSMHSKMDYITEAFRAGATGYLVKESAAEKLLNGLERVLDGEYFLDSSVSQKVAGDTLESEEAISDDAYQDLTSREQEILRLRAQGLSIRRISNKLFISPKTVENHCTNLMKKLNLHSSIELVRYAAKFGLIDVDEWKE